MIETYLRSNVHADTLPLEHPEGKALPQ